MEQVLSFLWDTSTPPNEVPTRTPIVTREPTEASISEREGEEQEDKPRYHIVRSGENCPSIAGFRDGNQWLVAILRAADRSRDDLYQSLREGEEPLTPDTLLVPTPEYPSCGPFTALLCSYEVDGSFMYFEWLAEM